MHGLCDCLVLALCNHTPPTARLPACLQRRRAAKEHHWAADDLERELAAVGLRIKTIEADGNCFFRSVLDQLEVGFGRGGEREAEEGGGSRLRMALLCALPSWQRRPLPLLLLRWLSGWAALHCRVRGVTTWACAAG